MIAVALQIIGYIASFILFVVPAKVRVFIDSFYHMINKPLRFTVILMKILSWEAILLVGTGFACCWTKDAELHGLYDKLNSFVNVQYDYHVLYLFADLFNPESGKLWALIKATDWTPLRMKIFALILIGGSVGIAMVVGLIFVIIANYKIMLPVLIIELGYRIYRKIKFDDEFGFRSPSEYFLDIEDMKENY